jgi:glycosyltransferase involved in cell wall biosynthesis
MKILLLTRFDDMAASSRMRVLQYVPYFEDADIEVEVRPCFNNADLKRRYTRGNHGFLKVSRRYFQRAAMLLRNNADIVWIEKELFPWMPAWFEQLLLRRRRYVMDFDDAIFHNYDEHRFGIVRSVFGKKIDRLMKNAAMIFAGNEYIADRARAAGNNNIRILPTVIDLDRYPIRDRDNPSQDGETVVGWIGSPYTTKYLQMLQKPLQKLSRNHNLRFRVIGARDIDMPGINVEQLQWEEQRESEMLSECDLGVMPLPDSPWERGKCGYKLIQYMACSKAVIGSPVGVNGQIVSPENGFLCTTEEEWHNALLDLIENPEKRVQMGLVGREIVEQRYCLQVTAPVVIENLKELAGDWDHKSRGSVQTPASQTDLNEVEELVSK